MDGGVIVIVQALISQVSLIPWPFIKRKGLVYTLSAHAPKLLGISLVWLPMHGLCEVNGN